MVSDLSGVANVAAYYVNPADGYVIFACSGGDPVMTCVTGKEAGPQPMHLSGTYTFHHYSLTDNIGNHSSYWADGHAEGLEGGTQSHGLGNLPDLVLE